MTDGRAVRTPRDVLARYQAAVLARSAGDLAALYAADGVHEIPFAFPGMSDRYTGPNQIRHEYARIWAASPARPQEFRDVRIHESGAGNTLVAEQTLVAVNTADGGTFEAPGVLVLHVRDGLLVRTRDYMDGLRVARALGRVTG